MIKYFSIFLLMCFILINKSKANFDTVTISDTATININCYIDTYYVTDNDFNSAFNRPLLNPLNTQKDAYDVNLVMISLSYLNKDFRSKATFHQGALARTAFPKNSNVIQEANIGVKLIEDLWLDAGYFLTHIGGEVSLPKDNWLSSLALSTQNEPIYQSGLKVTYDVNDKLQLQAHILNGYNIIEENNSSKSLGYFASYKFNDAFNISLSGIYGNEVYSGLDPNIYIIRYFDPWKAQKENYTKMLNNVIINYKVNKILQMRLSFDISSQKGMFVYEPDLIKPRPYTYGIFNTSSYGGFLSLKALISNKINATLRLEMYNSKIGTINYSSNAVGGTLGVEFKPNSNTYLRLESRSLSFEKDFSKIYPFSNRLEGIFTFGVYY